VARPTFLIAGAMKAGTTSLYRAVRRHPNVGRAVRKEVHFFDRKYELGMEWYEEQFRKKRKHQHVGEGTPVYMYDSVLRERIAKDLPDVKLIVSLRDPVQRAYSHYWHSKRYQREELPTFEDAFAAEPERLAAAEPRWRYRWSYLDRSRYVDQLEDLERLFGREQICVVTLEELKQEPDVEISRVFEYLGLDPSRRKESGLPMRNTFNEEKPRKLRKKRKAAPDQEHELPPSSYPPINPETRSRLMEEFQPYDARLKEWLGRSTLPWESLANE